MRVCLIAAVAFTSGFVRADELGGDGYTPPAPAEALGPRREATSAELLARGIRLRKVGDDLQALAAFEAAHAIEPTAQALAQMALAEQALGRWVDAHAHLTQAMADRQDGWVAAHEVTLRAAESEIDSHLGRLDVSCNIVGANVSVDGRQLGRTPVVAAAVVSGQSVLQVSAPGFFDVKRPVQIDPHGLSRVDVVLTEVAKSGEPPAQQLPAPTPGDEPAITREKLAYASFGLAGLGLVAGVSGYLLREKYVGLYNDDRRCDQQLGVRRSVECPDEYDTWRRAEQVAVGGIVTSAVFSGIGLYLWLAQPSADRSHHVACTVDVGALQCTGGF